MGRAGVLSHVYSFVFICIYLYQYKRKKKKEYIYIVCLCNATRFLFAASVMSANWHWIRTSDQSLTPAERICTRK